MEPNGLSGGMFSNMTTTTTSGLLALENPLQQQQQQQQQHLQHHSQMVSYHDTDIALQQQQQQQQQQLLKSGYPPFSAAAKNKQQQSINTLSDEEEQGGGVVGDENNNNSSGSPKRKASSSSPWQRMKWTDTMVRLLIMAVYYIGDEVGSEGTNSDPNGKKKPNGGLLQKKGKWKSVSRAMMEKGFYVSPQQCEDKFNDLNKRYKRVNDILGKGTACRVVENHKLLDTMDLSPKRREEVKKLLNSKHLFFREMCAYHNSCGHGVGGSGGDNNVSQQVEVRVEASHSSQQQQQQQKRGCFHSSENGEVNFGGAGQEGMRMFKVANGEKNYEYDGDGDGDDHDEDDDESEEDSDEDENESREGYSRGHGHDDEDENDGRLRKRPRITGSTLGLGLESGCSMTSSQLMQQLSSEVINVFQDGGRSPWEKKQWMRLRIMQLEEQQIKYHSEAFELEKQRLKWIRFSSKKERDMERAKLENEKRRLENERMVLMIREKELELVKLQRQQLQQQQHSST